MDEKVLLCGLFEVYGKLLTDKKREIFELYYMCDLSLSEVAEIKKISRQSVLDALKSAKSELFEYEEKLSFYRIKSDLLELGKSLGDGALSRITEIIED